MRVTKEKNEKKEKRKEKREKKRKQNYDKWFLPTVNRMAW